MRPTPIQRSCIAFCCDENYLPYALFAAHQILRHSPAGFDILICSTGPLTLPQGTAHPAIRTVAIDVRGAFDSFHRDERRNDLTYLRLLLAERLGAEYHRILYLDSDVFIRGGDFGSLLGIDMGGHPVAAVRDTCQWRSPWRHSGDMKRLGQPNAPYFNAGVLLLDTAAFNAQGILARALEFGAVHGGALYRADQTLLNCVLRDNWAEISPVWNWQYSWSARVFEPMAPTNIVHFIGPRKPWRDPEGILSPHFAIELSRFLEVHIPDAPRPPTPCNALGDVFFLRKMLIRSVLSAKKMQRYMQRFPTELTAIS